MLHFKVHSKKFLPDYHCSKPINFQEAIIKNIKYLFIFCGCDATDCSTENLIVIMLPRDLLLIIFSRKAAGLVVWAPKNMWLLPTLPKSFPQRHRVIILLKSPYSQFGYVGSSHTKIFKKYWIMFLNSNKMNLSNQCPRIWIHGPLKSMTSYFLTFWTKNHLIILQFTFRVSHKFWLRYNKIYCHVLLPWVSRK